MPGGLDISGPLCYLVCVGPVPLLRGLLLLGYPWTAKSRSAFQLGGFFYALWAPACCSAALPEVYPSCARPPPVSTRFRFVKARLTQQNLCHFVAFEICFKRNHRLKPPPNAVYSIFLLYIVILVFSAHFVKVCLLDHDFCFYFE